MNRINTLFGIEYPIVQGGMVWCSGWRLASAVSNAGGLGLLGAGSMHPETLREHIRKCRQATDKPFGINVPLMYPQLDEVMQLIVDEGVKIVFTSAGNPKLWTGFLKSHGITVVHVVSSSKFARKCEEAENRGATAEELKTLLGKGRAKKGMFEGDLDNGELEIGQVASLFREQQTAAEIVHDIVTEYRNLLNESKEKLSI